MRARILVTGTTLFAAFATSEPVAAQDSPSLTPKLNAYIECMNRLSARAYDSRQRYFSWVGKNGPTGKERIIYGTYTIYDTSDCKKNVEKVNAQDPREPELEAAATDYVTAVVALEPLLKEADDYYSQENYKDDKMAKGRALHPRLVAAWNAFAAADDKLTKTVEVIQDKRAIERLAEIERTEGKKGRYHIEALMIRAKQVLRAERHQRHHPGAGRVRGDRQGNGELCRRQREQHRLELHQQRQVVPGNVQAAHAPCTRQDPLQQRRPDDAQYRQWCLDGGRLTRAPDPRLQSTRRQL
jgi:hypothetical protein